MVSDFYFLKCLYRFFFCVGNYRFNRSSFDRVSVPLKDFVRVSKAKKQLKT